MCELDFSEAKAYKHRDDGENTGAIRGTSACCDAQLSLNNGKHHGKGSVALRAFA